VRSVTEAARTVSGAEIAAFFVVENVEVNEVLRLAARVSSPALERVTLTPPPAELLRHPLFAQDGLIRAPNLPGERDRTSCDGPIPFEPAAAKSYLAVRVVSRDGGIIGGLFLAHPHPDVFSEQVERTILAIAGQAAIAIDSANLYKALSRELEEKRKAEAALRHAQAELLEHAQALEAKVAERTASLREAIAQMEEFSYSVSHDLRAPLRAMNAYAQALADDYSDRLDATAKGYLDRIQRSSRRMENLTHDILTYSRVARAEIQLTEVDVETLLRDLLGQYVELRPDVADVEIAAPLYRVRAHESSLGQVMANLLTNAAKFVAPGVRPQIRIRSELTGERVRIWIEDNGIGISSAHQAGLFRVFERAPTPHAYEGTGIGLAIVRKAVDKMNGQCGVESDGQRGSRFWIELKKA
jgi:signal transduction histidine kinase